MSVMADMTHDYESPDARLAPLLADANRLRAKGDLEGAEKRCREALALAPGNWQAHEVLGDILYQARRGDEAIGHYRLARAANPQRWLIEDKIARASLLMAEADIARARTLDLLAGKRSQTPRRPGIAAVLSLVMPGLGQVYNGEHFKGVAILGVWLLLVLAAGVAALGSLVGKGAAGRPGLAPFDLGAVLGVFFSSPALWWTLPAMALWLYAIAEAALRAAKTMTGPEDLV